MEITKIYSCTILKTTSWKPRFFYICHKRVDYTKFFLVRVNFLLFHTVLTYCNFKGFIWIIHYLQTCIVYLKIQLKCNFYSFFFYFFNFQSKMQMGSDAVIKAKLKLAELCLKMNWRNFWKVTFFFRENILCKGCFEETECNVRWQLQIYFDCSMLRAQFSKLFEKPPLASSNWHWLVWSFYCNDYSVPSLNISLKRVLISTVSKFYTVW